jgi:hypothetical protein
MAGKTISAYTDSDTADSVAYLAKIEQRTPAQIAGIALKFFVKLPAPARTAWYQINALGDQSDLEKVTSEIARALLNTQYEISQRQVRESIEIDPQHNLESEDDILSTAIQLTVRESDG